jgi:ABC-2 type transport system ATP-binding protein
MVIEVKNLVKVFKTFERRAGISGSVQDLFYRNYKDFRAVDDISFSVGDGELLGYIGPNGAGKSTSIKILTGILKPTSGKINVLGYDPFLQRKTYTQKIGVVFGQRTQLWWDIAVQESFRLLGKIYQVSEHDYKTRLDNLIEILALKDLLGTPVRKLSLGQRMRCDLAASLIHNPRLLFLDEPTIGLDTVAKDSIRRFLKKINKEFGTTIILTTHDLKEIEELCQRILVLDHGKIIYDGSLEKIRGMRGLKRQMTVDFFGELPLSGLMQRFNDTVEISAQGDRRVAISYDPNSQPTGELVKLLFNQFDVADLSVSEPGIDEVIMKIYRDGYDAGAKS